MSPPPPLSLRKEIEEKLEALKSIHRNLSDKELALREREKELEAREKQLVSKKRVVSFSVVNNHKDCYFAKNHEIC